MKKNTNQNNYAISIGNITKAATITKIPQTASVEVSVTGAATKPRPLRFFGEPDPPMREPLESSSFTFSARHVPDATLLVGSGVVFTPDGKSIKDTTYMTSGVEMKSSTERWPQIDETRRVMIAYNAGWRNYYHWTIQSMFSTYVSLSYFGSAGNIFVYPQIHPNAKELLYYVAERQFSPEIYFLHPRAQVGFRRAAILNSTYKNLAFNPSPLLGEFARHVLKNCPAQRTDGRKIYISRRDSKKRTIENEDEVIKFLENQGFKALELSRLTVREQISAFAAAEIVVAAHGAGLTNVIYCNPNVRVIEMLPRSYQNPCFSTIGQALGIDWTVCVFDAGMLDGALPASQKVLPWRVDLDLLKSALAV
ncbi:glycosyltransferase family 61 protein [Jiella sonneratiae]|uniref:Glycosyltransferase family 61 protein n=1 Tax=Jiella sonneratiae TaxID=2816856 RepID=A0ABS3JA72_9HYPH|nr:glycosyltransferase 61 family protein [Jiella sonneratiae]MBO0906574.1 glycosyltransferase family 61 protein [Jiella sonneratiae]